MYEPENHHQAIVSSMLRFASFAVTSEDRAEQCPMSTAFALYGWS